MSTGFRGWDRAWLARRFSNPARPHEREMCEDKDLRRPSTQRASESVEDGPQFRKVTRVSLSGRVHGQPSDLHARRPPYPGGNQGLRNAARLRLGAAYARAA